MTTAQLIAAGLMTDQPHTRFTRPVEEAGHYQDAETGYWYNVAWRDGQILIAPLGVSAVYLGALGDYERLHGPVLDEVSDAAFSRYLAALDAWVDTQD